MDTQTAKQLIALNSNFYAQYAATFSATRASAWQGWQEVLQLIQKTGLLQKTGPLTIGDIACGNLRFARFWEQNVATPSSFFAVDNCLALVNSDTSDTTAPGAATHLSQLPEQHQSLTFLEKDILGELLIGSNPLAQLPPLDLVGCIGFMHHVPTFALREKLLQSIVCCVKPQGLIVFSFWQFRNDPRLARKSDEALLRAEKEPPYPGFNQEELEPGDYLLGWQENAHAYRYCHHTTDKEIDALLSPLITAQHTVAELARFSADGSSHTLNRYVVLQRI